MKKSSELRMRAKILALMLQMKDVIEQRKLEEESANGVNPNIAASAVIGGEFKLSPHTIAVLREMESVKRQIAATIQTKEEVI